ncbi:Indigoidine synthase A like protein-domain-containing protein [Plectosphaerella plurivora]|uniref:Indigoidine synthase A like protein-domain-containing protein n=1 Tax=Plectosphaerella plurivora TaxID=936078 RepID=A0A9P8VMV9_9PEZI|nr:Indigoidine synthase A like protein-domain-containing protein [Plectosphaerella plurivora]
MEAARIMSRLAGRSRPMSMSLRCGHPARRHLSSAAGIQQLLRVSEEVRDAVATDRPVVALESTIYTHGALGNDLLLEDIVRRNGAVPAVCGILDGVPTVGLTPEEIARMVESGNARKASRRDIAYLAGLGLRGEKIHGGTTISGTMLLARLAGIRVFGTGGLGGVHRGGEASMDVSADLTELGRTHVAVVSSGCKGFLDIPRTLEFLETHGAFVGTFADGRAPSEVDFPAFWARTSGIKSPAVVADEQDAAAMILAQERLGIESGMLFANPIPEVDGIPLDEMRVFIETAVREATEKGFTGANNTPYILKTIRALGGERIPLANKRLVQANVGRAARVAVELSKMLGAAPYPSPAQAVKSESSASKYHVSTSKAAPSAPPNEAGPVDILVAGSVAVDLSCDFQPLSPGKGQTPKLETSNPAAINQSIGGVGHNVALAAHRASSDSRVRLCSLVGDDTAGRTVLASLHANGLDTTYIRQLGSDYHVANRTAQYVAVNDADKSLVLAMADMGIFSNHSFPEYWRSAVAGAKPKWLVVDGNWSPKDVRAWVNAGREYGARVAFEPVSTAKSVALFSRDNLDLGVFPRAAVDLASPNTHELLAMWTAAKEHGFFDSHEWFRVMDAFGIHAGARERFVHMTSRALTDEGVPVQTMQLLPYIPTMVTKLGSRGCLLTTILGRDDPRLSDYAHREYILTRAHPDHPTVGGVYMRMYPAAEHVEDVVSVNGVGDTFLGVLVNGLARGGRVERLIDVAQKGAVLTLKSHEAVSPDLGRVDRLLREAIAE